MKLTKTTLKQIIKEELNKVLKEEDDGPTPGNIVDAAVFEIERATQKAGYQGEFLGDVIAMLKDADASAAQIAKIKAKYDSTASQALLNVLEDGDDEYGYSGQLKDMIITAWASSLNALSPGKARQEINRHLKSGQIDKDTWRKLRRKHHRRQKRKKRKPDIAGALDKMEKSKGHGFTPPKKGEKVPDIYTNKEKRKRGTKMSKDLSRGRQGAGEAALAKELIAAAGDPKKIAAIRKKYGFEDKDNTYKNPDLRPLSKRGTKVPGR